MNNGKSILGVVLFTIIVLVETPHVYALEEQLATFEDKILGIKFQYPLTWDPLTVTQKPPLNAIEFSHPHYATKMPYSLLEQRYTASQIRVENFFPNNMTLEQYMKVTFTNSRFLPDFTLVELNKTETLGGIKAYKLVYSYVDKTYGDDAQMTSLNVFTIKDYDAYLISVKAPTTMSFQYVPRMEKIIESFMITG
jgi:hypothetical protein